MQVVIVVSRLRSRGNYAGFCAMRGKKKGQQSTAEGKKIGRSTTRRHAANQMRCIYIDTIYTTYTVVLSLHSELGRLRCQYTAAGKT